MSNRGGGYYTSVDDGDASSQSQGSRSAKMVRTASFGALRNHVVWLGEQAQTQFLDRNLEAHANKSSSPPADGGSNNNNNNSVSIGMQSVSSIPKMILHSSSGQSYNSLNYFDPIQVQTVRFQVIVWSVGCPDVRNALVSMKFRVTLFWNNDNDYRPKNNDGVDIANGGSNNNLVGTTIDKSKKKRKKVPSIWVMAGRSAAYKKKITECPNDMIDIPPISILNADSFEVIGQPEVQLLREDSRLMRWSCMYRAQLHQDEMNVSEFPHDTHKLSLKLGILSGRQPGGRWDRRKWRLGLANEGDTAGSIRIPFGLLVDHVKIPEFEADKAGLDFSLSELKHGSVSAASSTMRDQDFYLRVALKVQRESGYYDKNIMPLLSVLNLVSISILTLDGDNYFQRGLMSLNIAFVEVGLRMALDNHLPSVGYQIKLQRILNFYFYSILSIVLESSVLKFLIENGQWDVASTRKIDFVWGLFLLMNWAYLQLVYTSFDRLRQDYESGL